MTAIATYSFDRIEIGDRRPIAEATVAELMRSIRQIGLLHPITVRKDGDKIRLVAGRNRLEAVKRLGIYAMIDAILVDCDARIAEIDENLIRGALSPIEEARAWAERKALYEAEHPETKVGAGTGGKKRRTKDDLAGSAESKDSHAAAAAKATGQGERTIRRKAQQGKALEHHDFDAAIGTVLDKPEELSALVSLQKESPEAVAPLIALAAAGKKVSAKTEVKKVKRAKREKDFAARVTAMPDQRFGVVLMDLPWKFEVRSEAGMDRSADNHFPTMTVDEMRELAIPAADDAVVFMWATVPFLAVALELIEHWGFEYKSHLVWIKNKSATGFWFRNRHELLLVATRGTVPAPANGEQFDSVITAPVGEHSAKPETAYEIIESYFPTVPRIELFARKARPGWDAWGNEVEAAE